MTESPFIRGFEDATAWLLDPVGTSEPSDYFKPPEGLAGCAGCTDDKVPPRGACPRCEYENGWADGASK